MWKSGIFWPRIEYSHVVVGLENFIVKTFLGCSFINTQSFCFICFREWYDPHAILMQEEGGVVSGLLVALNIIDCNFDLKGDSLDVWVSGQCKLLSFY